MASQLGLNPASCGVHALSTMMAHPHNRENCIMGNLLFLRRSYEYRHAAVAVFREARAMPMGPERNEARVLARGLRDLARTEAWLEGQRSKAGRQSPERLARTSVGA
jgi:hypothetical protein